MPIDAVACRSQLERLLRDETALLQVLEQQLESEHALLKANDIEGLEQAGAARQDTVMRLVRLEDERRQLCRMLGHDAGPEGVSAVLRWCDPQGGLAGAYEQCSTQAQRCREQNDRNGALVAARLQKVSSMLGALAPANASSGLYGPRGASDTAGRSNAGRVLTVRA
jgi:flagellar biosynthesis/type III secretory pathway chaperone